MHARELASALAVREGDYLAFLALLEELRLDGAVRALRGQRYGSVRGSKSTREVREGRVRVHPRGFGFVCTAGVADNVYVQEGALAGAMHGDDVRVEIMARSWRGLEGRVLEILRRANTRVQGVLRKRRHGAWLEVDDARIRQPIVLLGEVAGEDGDAAVVEIVRFPETGDENPEGKLIASLGAPGGLDVETRKVLFREGIEETFSEAVRVEVERVAASIDPSQADGREDIRALDLVTIDPKDARDRDDAIWVRETEHGFEAWVAIADVAEYVQSGTPLDQAARDRGFSLYLPDRAVPMLPATLSSKLCSLEHGEDRLCLALSMHFDDRGRRTSTRLCEAVMRSKATLSYEQVAAGMKWSSAPDVLLDPFVVEMVEHADELARLLRRRRMRRGALELAAPEPEIVLDPNTGMPQDVVRRAQDPGVKRAYELIEELMVASNEAVAEWMEERHAPTIFRVHPPPSESRLARLAELCDSLKIEFDVDDAVDPKRLGKFLRSVQEHPLVEILGMLALRSLAPASYDTLNVGHFGLASRAYAHFTSPIRRYPDLVVHRQVKRMLREEKGEAVAYQDIAMQCTRRERELVEVEREVFDVYRCAMMRDRLGAASVGRVTDIGTSSVTVTLDAPFVDVLVPEGLLGLSGYERSDDGLHLVAQRSGDRISLGEQMEVEVESVDMTRRVVFGKRVVDREVSAMRSHVPRRPIRARHEARKPAKHKKKVKRG